MRLTSFASSAGRRTAPAALILLLALLAGTWTVAQVASTGRAPAEPPGQSLAGSFVVFDPSQGGVTGYQPGLPQDFCFRAESFTNDWEYVYVLWLRFPTGWVVNNVTVVGSPTCTRHLGPLVGPTKLRAMRSVSTTRGIVTTDHARPTTQVNATRRPGRHHRFPWYWDGMTTVATARPVQQRQLPRSKRGTARPGRTQASSCRTVALQIISMPDASPPRLPGRDVDHTPTSST
jgi:hypothetical protein